MPGCADDTPVCPLKISQLAKAPSNLGPQPHHPPSDETPSGLSTVGTLGEGIIPSECPQLEDMVAHQACGHSIHTTNSWGKTPKNGSTAALEMPGKTGRLKAQSKASCRDGEVLQDGTSSKEKRQKTSPIWGYLPVQRSPKAGVLGLGVCSGGAGGWGCL